MRNKQVVKSRPGLVSKGGLLERLGLQPSGGPRRGVQFEGSKYTLGDFKLFIGQATNFSGSREFLSVVAEIEYLPLSSTAAAQSVLKAGTVCASSDSHAAIASSSFIFALPAHV